jgi:hypothetical protein
MTLHVSVGQGGNQLGSVFWNLADKQYLREESKEWLGGAHPLYVRNTPDADCAAAVWIDSEPKVVSALVRKGGTQSCKAVDTVMDDSGR